MLRPSCFRKSPKRPKQCIQDGRRIRHHLGHASVVAYEQAQLQHRHRSIHGRFANHGIDPWLNDNILQEYRCMNPRRFLLRKHSPCLHIEPLTRELIRVRELLNSSHRPNPRIDRRLLYLLLQRDCHLRRDPLDDNQPLRVMEQLR